MNNKLYIFFLIPVIVFLSHDSRADNPFPVIVERIIVTGNRTTDEAVILRELEHRVGGIFTPEMLGYEERRLYSLGLFNRVQITHFMDDNSATILIDVHERWYIFPVPVLGIKDRDWSKVYYGGGLLHDNFRGRNEKLWAGFALGYDPWVSAAYKTPSFMGMENVFFEGEFTYIKTENRSVRYEAELRDFSETRYLAGIKIGRRLSLYTTLGFYAGYNWISVSDYVPGHTKSEEGRDRYPVAALTYTYDTRDIIEYAMYGSYVKLSAAKMGFGGEGVDHFRTSADLRGYMPVTERLTLAGRMYTDIAGGTRLPHYSHAFIGYEERIRGHYSNVFEGENVFLSSLEARFRLLGPRYIELKSAVVPQFSVLRYGVNLALFADLGTAWYRDDFIGGLRPAKGFGGGVHLLLPYSLVMRFEYAMNEKFDGEFIIDLFVMF